MKSNLYSILMHLRILHQTLFGEKKQYPSLILRSQKDYSNRLISSYLESDNPCMIARFGDNELLSMVNYLNVKHGKRDILDFIRQRIPAWWWNEERLKGLALGAGFFPVTEEYIGAFYELMIQDMLDVDILGSWIPEEVVFKDRLKSAKRVVLGDLEPFFSSTPWTWKLKGKKVLIIHPFVETILLQYPNREKIFPDKMLPEFDLQVYRPVQSLANNKTPYNNWFEALDFMKAELENLNFDICILGCGAYGFPLAAHIKRMGKKAIHLGGATQLLFGIRGRRWEDSYSRTFPYSNLFNDYWCRPLKSNQLENLHLVEGGCYW
ncbi:MAG: hypothetical protein RR202_05785 [Bacteroidales bacterium]